MSCACQSKITHRLELGIACWRRACARVEGHRAEEVIRAETERQGKDKVGKRVRLGLYKTRFQGNGGSYRRKLTLQESCHPSERNPDHRAKNDAGEVGTRSDALGIRLSIQ